MPSCHFCGWVNRCKRCQLHAGTLPVDWANMTTLQSLSLGGNNLTGKLRHPLDNLQMPIGGVGGKPLPVREIEGISLIHLACPAGEVFIAECQAGAASNTHHVCNGTMSL